MPTPRKTTSSPPEAPAEPYRAADPAGTADEVLGGRDDSGAAAAAPADTCDKCGQRLGQAPAAAADTAPQEGPICLQCYPYGWAGLPANAYTAGCAHGSYSRRP